MAIHRVGFGSPIIERYEYTDSIDFLMWRALFCFC
ncbi:hypothetical protein X946_3120 [Burkholderia sp. ABCPW 111]|nr:hypothetical protein X946_3120 [Burkholderia sp. ABCPW 111]